MELYYFLSVIIGIFILIVFAILIYYDFRYQKLPNILIVIQVILCIIFTFFTEIKIEQKSYSIVFINHLLALIPISGLYFVVYILSRGKLIGLGDIKLGIPIAVLLPWQGALLTLGIANILALLVYLPLLITKKVKMNTKFSFGPFLIVACLFSFFAMKFFVNFF